MGKVCGGKFEDGRETKLPGQKETFKAKMA